MHLLPERNKNDLKATVSDEAFQCRLAFLADMSSHLNELNRKLQGADSDIISHRDKVNAFVSKLELWRRRFEIGRNGIVEVSTQNYRTIWSVKQRLSNTSMRYLLKLC